MRKTLILAAVIAATGCAAHAQSVRVCMPMAQSAEVIARRISMGLDPSGGIPQMEKLVHDGMVKYEVLLEYKQMILDLKSHPNITPETAYQLSIAACGWKALSSY